MPFDPTTQQIFHYCDGTRDSEGKFRVRRGDPVAIYRKLMAAVGGSDAFNKMWNEACTNGPNREEHERNLVTVIQHAFEIKPLDPYVEEGVQSEGLGREGTLEILADYYDWQKKSARSTAGSPNISRPTPGSHSRSMTSPMRHMSGSGSTDTASIPSPRSLTSEHSISPTEPHPIAG